MSEVLLGKVAIITGASRGIGAAIAKRFAAEGAKVAITARTLCSDNAGSGSLEGVAEQIRRRGGDCLTIAADLADSSQRPDIVARTIAQWGKVDILVNNAARGFYEPTVEISRKRILLSYEINVFAPIDLLQRCAPHMREQGGGWVLNISSATVKHPEAAPYDSNARYTRFHREQGPTIYASTKSALERVSAGAAAELAPYGIAVNTLAPVEAVASEGALALGTIDTAAAYESVETMAEAALLLCSEPRASCSGLCVLSQPLLERYQREVKSLCGDTL